jgi:hypothetical protein
MYAIFLAWTAPKPVSVLNKFGNAVLGHGSNKGFIREERESLARRKTSAIQGSQKCVECLEGFSQPLTGHELNPTQKSRSSDHQQYFMVVNECPTTKTDTRCNAIAFKKRLYV